MRLDADLQKKLVVQAAQSPSVHNVQPARWRFDGEALHLIEDTTRRIPAGDPSGRDTAVSLGAAAEGMALALSARGLSLVADEAGDAQPPEDDRYPVARRFRIGAGAGADPLAAVLGERYSHRAAFAAVTEADRLAAQALGDEGVAVITQADALQATARLYDAASLRFFRNTEFRAELLSWMRLSRDHPRWAIDGLNAEAMAMSPIEAMGAGMVLGPKAFAIFDRLGLAGPLTAEASRVTGSAAVLVLHRPATEDPFDTGRVFHRQWLSVVAAGFQGAVMAALADDEAARTALAAIAGVPDGRRIVTTLRIGRPSGTAPVRARMNVDDVLL